MRNLFKRAIPRPVVYHDDNALIHVFLFIFSLVIVAWFLTLFANQIIQIGTILGGVGYGLKWLLKKREKKREIRLELEQMGRMTRIEEYLNSDKLKETPDFFRKNHYEWGDFARGHVYLRKGIVGDIEKALGKQSIVMLLARSGTGKSTIAHTLGFELLTKKSPMRFIYYVDLVLDSWAPNDLVERLMTIKHKMKDHGGWGSKKALLILDNAHLDRALVHTLSRSFKQNLGERIRVLLLARSQSVDIKHSALEWQNELTDYGVNNDILKIIILEEEELAHAVEGIAGLFLQIEGLPQRMRQTESENLVQYTLTRFINAMTEMSCGNLMHLKMVLRALHEMNVPPTQEVLRKIDITQAVAHHYDRLYKYALESKEIAEALQAIELKSELKGVDIFHRLLLTIALFTQIEITIPKRFVYKVAETDSMLFNRLWSFLVAHGELLESNGIAARLPHLATAEILTKLFKDEYKKISFQKILNDSAIIPQSPFGLKHGIHELACLALLIYLEKKRALTGGSVSMMLNRCYPSLPDESTPYSLTNFLLSHQDLLVAALAERPTLISSFMKSTAFCERDDTASVVARVISDTDEPWYAVDGILGWVFLEEDNNVITSIRSRINDIANAIKSVDEPSPIIHAITGWPDLVQSERMQDAITDAIKTVNEPWRIFEKVLGYLAAERTGIICTAMMHRIEDIEEAIKTLDKPWIIISAIGGWPELEGSGHIQEAIAHTIRATGEQMKNQTYEIRKIVDAICGSMILKKSLAIQSALGEVIRTSKASDKFFAEFREIPEFRDSNPIQAAVKKRYLDIMFNRVPPYGRIDAWDMINSIRGWPELEKDKNVLDFIRKRMDELVGRIKNASILWPYIHRFYGWSLLEENKLIRDAVVEGIPKTDEPWRVVGAIQKCSKLKNDGDLREAIGKRADDIADAIRSCFAPWEIIGDIIGWRELEMNEEVQSAIADAIMVTEPDSPWYVIGAIKGRSPLINSIRIRTAIEQRIPFIAVAIKTKWGPWKILEAIKGFSYIEENQEICDAIRFRIPELARAILRTKSSDAEMIAKSIIGIKSVCNDSQILEAVRKRWQSPNENTLA